MKNSVVNLLSVLFLKKVRGYGHDFLQTWDKSADELEATLLVGQILKILRYENKNTRMFNSGLAISWFRDKSTRTRFSFRSAANLLGLDVADLDEEKSQIAHGESVQETANMISFLTNVIGIRDDIYLGEGHSFMKKVAESVDYGYEMRILPDRPSVINLQCDRDHPTQSMSDLWHLQTYFGNLENLKGKKIVLSWAYSPSYGKPLSVAQGFCGLLTRFGAHVTLAYPQGYNLIPELERKFVTQAAKSGGKFTVMHDMTEACSGAEVVYAKSWASYDVMQRRTKLLAARDQTGLRKLEEEALAKNAKHKDWECNERIMKNTKKGKGLYMHCLPADVSGVNCKEGEVSKRIFERYKKRTYVQAGYKPYIIAAMIVLSQFADPARVLERLVNGTEPRKA